MFSRHFLSLLLSLLFISTACRAASSPAPEKISPPCSSIGGEKPFVCFSPDQDCTDRISEEIDKARKSVRVQAFSFTSLPIAQALASAEKRGVSVEVILDRENYSKEFTQTPVLSKAGVSVDLDGAHATAHNKVIVIDGQTVVTGSFNFTKAAQEKNAENVLILHDTEVAQAYLKNWQAHRDHSERLNSR